MRRRAPAHVRGFVILFLLVGWIDTAMSWAGIMSPHGTTRTRTTCSMRLRLRQPSGRPAPELCSAARRHAGGNRRLTHRERPYSGAIGRNFLVARHATPIRLPDDRRGSYNHLQNDIL